jgi:tetratricopeptide (TPR) repeat protein
MSEKLDKLIDMMNKSPKYSKERLLICEELVKVADLENNMLYSFEGRKEIIRIDKFTGDGFKAILTFPKLLWAGDEYLKKSNKQREYVQFYIVWTLESMMYMCDDYYQVEYEKLNEIIKEYKKRCIEYGYSLRVYYKYMTLGYMELEDVEKAKEAFKKFKSCSRDEISDCEVCELRFEVKYELFLNNYEKALKLAGPIFKGEKKCTTALPLTYEHFLEYYINHNMLEEAKEYREKMYRLISKDELYLGNMDIQLIYFAITNPKKGVKIFTKHLKWALSSNNGDDKFAFYTGAWMLWESFKYKEKRERCKLILPEDTPFYKDDGIYLVDDIINYCREQALSIGEKFDKRNRNAVYMNFINKMKKLVF